MAIDRSKQREEDRGILYRVNIPANLKDDKAEYLKTEMNRVLTRLSSQLLDMQRQIDSLKKGK